MSVSLKEKFINYLESLVVPRTERARLNRICVRLKKPDIVITDTQENTVLICQFIGKLFTSMPVLMSNENKKLTEEFSARYIETPTQRRKRDLS